MGGPTLTCAMPSGTHACKIAAEGEGEVSEAAHLLTALEVTVSLLLITHGPESAHMAPTALQGKLGNTEEPLHVQ